MCRLLFLLVATPLKPPNNLYTPPLVPEHRDCASLFVMTPQKRHTLFRLTFVAPVFLRPQSSKYGVIPANHPTALRQPKCAILQKKKKKNHGFATLLTPITKTVHPRDLACAKHLLFCVAHPQSKTMTAANHPKSLKSIQIVPKNKHFSLLFALKTMILHLDQTKNKTPLLPHSHSQANFSTSSTILVTVHPQNGNLLPWQRKNSACDVTLPLHNPCRCIRHPRNGVVTALTPLKNPKIIQLLPKNHIFPSLFPLKTTILYH